MNFHVHVCRSHSPLEGAATSTLVAPFYSGFTGLFYSGYLYDCHEMFACTGGSDPNLELDGSGSQIPIQRSILHHLTLCISKQQPIRYAPPPWSLPSPSPFDPPAKSRSRQTPDSGKAVAPLSTKSLPRAGSINPRRPCRARARHHGREGRVAVGDQLRDDDEGVGVQGRDGVDEMAEPLRRLRRVLT